MWHTTESLNIYSLIFRCVFNNLLQSIHIIYRNSILDRIKISTESYVNSHYWISRCVYSIGEQCRHLRANFYTVHSRAIFFDMCMCVCRYVFSRIRASALHRDIYISRITAWIQNSHSAREHSHPPMHMVAAINKRPYQGADLIPIPITSLHLFRDSTDIRRMRYWPSRCAFINNARDVAETDVQECSQTRCNHANCAKIENLCFCQRNIQR